ncbi:uncharacterized protein LOC115767861 [Drosophila novamexicana]|uniref:uncharacterized protein LOC115767861 n=1 Tax=Drosophila novamexicana TaxID=47314 RepID=UPI0011E59DF8|nr:uncharacterized protein LOC115767861 [Drosophila novamexicana]
MCDVGNLIDLTGWDEPVKDETVIEDVLTRANNFKGPYDPFDSMEKEACIKGENFKNDMERTQTTVDIKLHENEDNDFNNETPPVTMEFSPKNADANKNSSTGSESRHRTLQQLAKLNATRLSSIKTPTQNQLANFPSNVIGSCFESSFLSENLQMIAAESPVKLIEDEPNPIPDTSPVTPLSDDACSNSEFEARLKMMRIAMLDSPAKSDPPAAVLSEQNLMTTTPTTSVNSPTLGTNAADVGKLLQDLKCLICEHVDISKREQFNKLLESIRAAVQCSTPTAEVSGRMGKESPHVYTRQATFDLDLELQKGKAASADNVRTVNENIQEFPDAMTCSSATYDAESLDKPASPATETEYQKQTPDKTHKKPDSYVTGVVDDNLALQINELLERHNLTKLHNNDSDQHHRESEHSQTVIFVVNSTGVNQLPNCIVHPSTTRAVQSVANNSQENTLRRRSSSLSIHDKSKQDRPKSPAKQSSGDSHNPYVPLKALSNVGDKMNAMASFRQRRNSFSIGSTVGKTSASAAAQARTHMAGGRTKVTAINESQIKPCASTKVNIPVKRVVPMVKPTLASTEVTYLNSTTARCNGQDTPITAKGKTGSKLFCTSTPMPQMRSFQRRSLKPVISYSSSSCASTPSLRPASYTKKAAQ